MNTLRQYNSLKQSLYYPRNEKASINKSQKEGIKAFWKDRFIRFVPSEDKRYISYMVRV